MPRFVAGFARIQQVLNSCESSYGSFTLRLEVSRPESSQHMPRNRKSRAQQLQEHNPNSLPIGFSPRFRLELRSDHFVEFGFYAASRLGL